MTTEADNNSEMTNEVCASCGIAAIDNVTLKKCGGCELVEYCSVECQKNHGPQHKQACKKRMAEIRDDRLFTQPKISCYGECPICCLPLPIPEASQYGGREMTCCSKIICRGCCYAAVVESALNERRFRCPFCREPLPKTKEMNQNRMKRVKANDPFALQWAGGLCHHEGDIEGAIQYWTKAAELGEMDAHFNLSLMYQRGEGVEKDQKKVIYHLEEAAIGGHPEARYNLGVYEKDGDGGSYDKAVKHFIIAANLGYDDALDTLKDCFLNGLVSKEVYASALRGHQAAVDATKSKHREEAEKIGMK